MTPSTFHPVSLQPDARAPAAVLPLTTQEVSHVFKRLQAQLGVKLADLYVGVKPEDVRAEWAGALGGFQDAEIVRGLEACRTRAFAPNLGEFLNLCRPALDPEIAWMEAADGMAARAAGQVGNWSHPAVFRAAQRFTYELRTRTFKESRKTWTYALQREFALGWGEPVPAPPLQIEQRVAPRSLPTAEQAAAWGKLLGRPVLSKKGRV